MKKYCVTVHCLESIINVTLEANNEAEAIQLALEQFKGKFVLAEYFRAESCVEL